MRILSAIESSDIHHRLGLQKGRYILLSAHREENIDTEKNFLSLFKAVNAMARNMTCQFSTVVILAAGSVWRQVALNLTAAWCSMNLSVSMITTACR